MSESEPWTIGRLLTWTTEHLGQRGFASPRLEAEVLLAAALACERIDLYAAYQQTPTDDQRAAFRELIRRRGAGEPVAYLVGRREFFSLSFRVSPAVLIPRPETELLVVELLGRAKSMSSQDRAPRIADMGTGSGAVAVCAAKYAERSEVTAVDVSPQALEVARQNAAAHDVASRIRFIESDLFAAVPTGAPFDIVASNPPYVSTAEMQALPRDVREHEPALALAAGERGTAVIERLIPQAAERLAPDGWLLMEISPMIEAAVRELITADGRFEPARVIKDLAGHARVVEARRSA